MLPSEAFISVPPLEGEDITEIISSWLHSKKRALQPDQRKLLEVNTRSTNLRNLLRRNLKLAQLYRNLKLTVLSNKEACQKCRLPLYTKIAFDEAISWHSYTPIGDVTLGDNVTTLIHVLMERVEKYHGTVLVEHALGYITAAKAGLRSVYLASLRTIQASVIVIKLYFNFSIWKNLFGIRS